MNHWKYVVIGLLLSVAIFHIGAIFYIGDRDYQLTSTDYYDREIAYQDTLEALRAGKAYIWTTEEQGQYLYIAVRDVNQQPVTLNQPKARLYKPNDAALDQDQDMELTGPGNYRLTVGQLKAGPWKLTVEGQQNDQAIAWQTRLLRR